MHYKLIIATLMTDRVLADFSLTAHMGFAASLLGMLSEFLKNVSSSTTIWCQD
jgi:hypothetical protein